MDEVVDPFVEDMRRRASLGLADAAAVVETGIVTGLDMVDPPEGGTVLGYAGPDVPRELANAVLQEAERLGLEIAAAEAWSRWPEWDQRA